MNVSCERNVALDCGRNWGFDGFVGESDVVVVTLAAAAAAAAAAIVAVSEFVVGVADDCVLVFCILVLFFGIGSCGWLVASLLWLTMLYWMRHTRPSSSKNARWLVDTTASTTLVMLDSTVGCV